MNKGNSKTSERHKLVLSPPQILNLKSSDKYIPFQNLSIYYTRKNIRQQVENNKLKIIFPTWNDEFELPDGSYSVLDIQYYIEEIIKKHETLTDNLPNLIYINRINNRLGFKIKDRYKIEL